MRHSPSRCNATVWTRRTNLGGIETSAILQFVLRVEAEEIGCALSVINSRHLLCLVEHIR